ncbi:hypothetical protein [Streptomyces marincola]|uniref:hypothetical protein n=1 Tax=Streptomyces marincola TaxID=2878388 RepID=UPI001CF23E45|nr:hypothetical protein [Streptomyces marincola]UCM90775.1 hypothetical protein LC193_24105 [Streptomyces marincola]
MKRSNSRTPGKVNCPEGSLAGTCAATYTAANLGQSTEGRPEQRMAAYRPTYRKGIPILLACAALLIACGGAEYRYTVPEEMCGASVHAEALRGLLPPGDVIDAAPRDIRSAKTCDVTVDDEVQISVTGYSSDETEDALTYARSNEFPEPEEVELIDGGSGAVWVDGAVAAWSCRDPSTYDSYTHVLAVIHVPGDHAEGDERRERVADFARSYVAGLAAKLDCDV